jgi:hypothetical protein
MQTHQIDRVVEVVEETLQGRTVRLLSQKKSDGRKLGALPTAAARHPARGPCSPKDSALPNKGVPP